MSKKIYIAPPDNIIHEMLNEPRLINAYKLVSFFDIPQPDQNEREQAAMRITAGNPQKCDHETLSKPFKIKNYKDYTNKDFEAILERELKTDTLEKTDENIKYLIPYIVKTIEEYKKYYEENTKTVLTKDRNLLILADRFLNWISYQNIERPSATAVALLYAFPIESNESYEGITTTNAQTIAESHYPKPVSTTAGDHLRKTYNSLCISKDKSNTRLPKRTTPSTPKLIMLRIKDIEYALSKMDPKFKKAKSSAEDEIIQLKSVLLTSNKSK